MNDWVTETIIEGMKKTRLRILEQQCKSCCDLKCEACIFRDILENFMIASHRMVILSKDRNELRGGLR